MRADEVEALYNQFAPAVHRRAKQLLGNSPDAWDAVQEVFERMLTAGTEFRRAARPMTWLYRITTHVCLNRLRSAKVRATEPDASEDVARADDSVEARNTLRAWLAKLEPREVEVAVLLYMDGLSQDEAAQVLGVSRKTVVRDVDAMREKLGAESTHD